MSEIPRDFHRSFLKLWPSTPKSSWVAYCDQIPSSKESIAWMTVEIIKVRSFLETYPYSLREDGK